MWALVNILLFPKSCVKAKKSKGILVTGREDLWGCMMLRIPHCLDNQWTDGGKVVNPAHRPRFTPQNIIFLLLVLISVRGRVNPKAVVELEGLDKLKKFIYLNGSQTHDHPDCSIVP
jgi:hypothetical protein